MILLEDALRNHHHLKVNDKALGLYDSSSGKYGPCDVLEQHPTNSSSYIVRFSDGSTRTLNKAHINESLVWIPDAVYDRIKYELNLPSKARKYLEEQEEYMSPKKGVGICGSDHVVMPRMIYDVWPFFVPFYPLHSNILYSNSASSLVASSSNPSLSLPLSLAVSTSSSSQILVPQYGRQIKVFFSFSFVHFVFFWLKTTFVKI